MMSTTGKIKKIAVVMLVLCFAFQGCLVQRSTGTGFIPSGNRLVCRVLMEFSREEIIFDKNSTEQLPPASLTKIMTLYCPMKLYSKVKLPGRKRLPSAKRLGKQAAPRCFWK